MNRSTSLITFAFAALTVFGVNAQAQDLLVNGNFATGSLAPWVPFTTPNGTNGANLPTVVSRQLEGTTVYSAHFNVGQVTYTQGQQAGGGISQIVSLTTPGTYSFSASFVSKDDTSGEINADAGTYSIVIDGKTVASTSLGGFTSPHQTIAGKLSGSTTLTAGSHTFEVMITRMYGSGPGASPSETVTFISLSLQ